MSVFAKYYGLMAVRCMLWLSWLGIMEAVQCFCVVLRHCKIELLVSVVPIKGYITKEFASPVNGDFVVVGKDIDQIFCILFSFIFNSKIIHNKHM